MMEGIDVSYCQAGFDFQAAADAGKEFCIVRIGRYVLRSHTQWRQA